MKKNSYNPLQKLLSGRLVAQSLDMPFDPVEWHNNYYNLLTPLGKIAIVDTTNGITQNVWVKNEILLYSQYLIVVNYNYHPGVILGWTTTKLANNYTRVPWGTENCVSIPKIVLRPLSTLQNKLLKSVAISIQ